MSGQSDRFETFEPEPPDRGPTPRFGVSGESTQKNCPPPRVDTQIARAEDAPTLGTPQAGGTLQSRFHPPTPGNQHSEGSQNQVAGHYGNVADLRELLIGIGALPNQFDLAAFDRAVRSMSGAVDVESVVTSLTETTANWSQEFDEEYPILTKFQAKQVLAGNGLLLRMDHYLILDWIGKGGMGEVYKARHTTLPQVVAIKTIRHMESEALKRFRRETALLAKLHHPGITTIHHAGKIDEVDYLAMEYVEGQDLVQLTEATDYEHAPIPVRRAVGWCLAVAEALQYAHSRGIIHRDIKPNNVMVAKDGQVKLLDMGIAKLLSVDQSLTGMGTMRGTSLGTPTFMPPEQWSDAKSVSPASDVYSLGGTLYFILTGKPPFDTENLPELMTAHLTKPPPPITASRPKIPRRLDPVLRKMLAKKQSERYQTMTEVIEALRPFTLDQPPAPRFLPWLVGVGSCTVLAGLLALGYHLLSSGRPEEPAVDGTPTALLEEAAVGASRPDEPQRPEPSDIAGTPGPQSAESGSDAVPSTNQRATETQAAPLATEPARVPVVPEPSTPTVPQEPVASPKEPPADEPPTVDGHREGTTPDSMKPPTSPEPAPTQPSPPKETSVPAALKKPKASPKEPSAHEPAVVDERREETTPDSMKPPTPPEPEPAPTQLAPPKEPTVPATAPDPMPPTDSDPIPPQENAPAKKMALPAKPSPEQLLKEAHRDLEAGQYRSAIEKLGQVLDESPERPEALLTRGQARLKLGELAEAKQDLLQALALQPEDPASRAAARELYDRLASSAVGPSATHHERVVATYLEAKDHHLDTDVSAIAAADAYRALAEQTLASNEPAAGLAHLDRAVQLYEKCQRDEQLADCLMLRAQAKMKSNDYEAALTDFQQVRQLRQEQSPEVSARIADALEAWSQQLERSEEFALALQQLQQASQEQPTQSKRYQDRMATIARKWGDLLLQRGKASEAVEKLTAAIGYDPTDATTHAQRAKANLQLASLSDNELKSRAKLVRNAVDDYLRAADLDPASSQKYRDLAASAAAGFAAVASQQGERQSAIQWYDEAVRLGGDEKSTYQQQLAQVHERIGEDRLGDDDFKSAIAAFRRAEALTAAEERSTILAEIGAAYVKWGDRLASQASFSEAIARFSSGLEAYEDKATDATEDTLAPIRVKRASAYFARGQQQKDNPAKAIEDYTQAIADYGKAGAGHLGGPEKYAGTLAPVHAARGECELAVNDFERAAQDFETAIKLDSQLQAQFSKPCARAYLALARTAFAEDGTKAAIDACTKALALWESIDAAYQLRGDCYWKIEDYAKAVDDYTLALKHDSGDEHSRSYREGIWNWYLDQEELATLVKSIDRVAALNEADRDRCAFWTRKLADLAKAKNLQATQLATGKKSERDGRKAIRYATQACELVKWKDVDYLSILACAHAEAGEFERAIQRGREAEKIAPTEAQKKACRVLIELFEKGQAFPGPE